MAAIHELRAAAAIAMGLICEVEVGDHFCSSFLVDLSTKQQATKKGGRTSALSLSQLSICMGGKLWWVPFRSSGVTTYSFCFRVRLGLL